MIFNFVYNDIPIKLDLHDDEDFLSRQIIEFETFYERRYLNFLFNNRKLLFPKKVNTVLDVGAYIGNHTVFFAKVLGCRVHSFEAQRDIYSTLRKNIQINRIAHLVTSKNIGISQRKSSLKVIKKYDNMGGSTRWWYAGRSNLQEVQSIQCKSLDELIHSEINFIKIDVEGMELEVLRGAKRIINMYSPIMMIEITEINGEFPNLKPFQNWMKYHKYQIIEHLQFNRHTYLIARKDRFKPFNEKPKQLEELKEPEQLKESEEPEEFKELT